MISSIEILSHIVTFTIYTQRCVSICNLSPESMILQMPVTHLSENINYSINSVILEEHFMNNSSKYAGYRSTVNHIAVLISACRLLVLQQCHFQY